VGVYVHKIVAINKQFNYFIVVYFETAPTGLLIALSQCPLLVLHTNFTTAVTTSCLKVEVAGSREMLVTRY
jgi:hypothetical protein